MGELMEAFDHQNNKVSFTYDLLGRNLSVSSADTGTITYDYDIAGNLIEKTDNNLRAIGESIRYEYDGLNRMTRINYPRMADTLMVYGEADRSDNASGRLISTTDESGTLINEYGKLGEVTTMTRTLNRLSLGTDALTISMGYKSDYLGRMEEISYPDGEVVSYGYDSGGQVTSVTGTRLGVVTEYIKKVGYDEFGQRKYISYGNGTETTYDYDADRRWLSSLKSSNRLGRNIQNISYSFDRVGNISMLVNDSELYKTTQTYGYDDLYQLVQAKGVYESRPTGSLDYTSQYSQDFKFDSIGNIQSKNSSQFYSPARADAENLNYNLDYVYYRNKPHQAERIGKLWYIYDGNGNVIEEREGGHSTPADDSSGAGLESRDNLYWTNYGFGLFSSGEEEEKVYCRDFTWDEENRLKESSDINYTVNYLYDSSGERTAKYSSLGETLYFNSMWQETPEDSLNNRQSKHIYIGESRFVTRLSYKDSQTTGYEEVNTYYYHGDHLGSVNMVTDYNGEVYEHIEYTPYGELWVEEKSDELDKIPFRFTAKEWDEETSLYYMSARYQNPMTSRWMSADPAGMQLVNPMDGDGNLRSGFNLVESVNWYSYVGNNPVKYSDPTGMASTGWSLSSHSIIFDKKNQTLSFSFSLNNTSGKALNLQGSFEMSSPVLPAEKGPRQSLSRSGSEQGLVFPKEIPDGDWKITEVGYNDNPIIGFFLRTDAEQELPLVEMVDGEWTETGETVIDSRYLLHEEHGYTLGCGATDKENLEGNIELFETAFILNGKTLDLKIIGGETDE